MKPTKTQHIKILTLCAAAAAAGLRAAHYAFGTDGRGLLVANHWAVVGLWVVSAGFAAMLLFSLGRVSATDDCTAARPSGMVAAAGCFVLAAGLAVTSLLQYSFFEATAERIVRILGLVAAAGALAAGICRIKGKQPSFLTHTALCLFITLRMILQYRHWSADPQLQDYGFYLCAHVALMLASYHHAAFDVGMGNRRALWIWSLCSVYLCCAAIPHCSEALLMGCCAFWALTNLNIAPAPGHQDAPASGHQERTEP